MQSQCCYALDTNFLLHEKNLKNVSQEEKWNK